MKAIPALERRCLWMLSPVQFGKAARILADTREAGFAIATAMRDREIAEGRAATVMEFKFEPDVFFMVSGPEYRMATEPPEELQDEFEGSDPEELPDLITAAMQYVHHRIAELAEEYDFRLGGTYESAIRNAALSEAYCIRSGKNPGDIGRAHQAAFEIRDRLKDEYGIDPRDAVIFTPNNDQGATYMFYGEARDCFRQLHTQKGKPFEAAFSEFIKSLQEAGGLEKIDLRQEET